MTIEEPDRFRDFVTIFDCEPPPMETWYRVIEEEWEQTSKAMYRRIKKWEPSNRVWGDGYVLPSRDGG